MPSKKELEKQIRELRSEFEKQIAELRSEVRSDIYKLEVKLTISRYPDYGNVVFWAPITYKLKDIVEAILNHLKLEPVKIFATPEQVELKPIGKQ